MTNTMTPSEARGMLPEEEVGSDHGILVSKDGRVPRKGGHPETFRYLETSELAGLRRASCTQPIS